ncbi:MAG: hypothetical protein ACPGQL_10095 [Thermoplasmatota archaeon]
MTRAPNGRRDRQARNADGTRKGLGPATVVAVTLGVLAAALAAALLLESTDQLRARGSGAAAGSTPIDTLVPQEAHLVPGSGGGDPELVVLLGAKASHGDLGVDLEALSLRLTSADGRSQDHPLTAATVLRDADGSTAAGASDHGARLANQGDLLELRIPWPLDDGRPPASWELVQQQGGVALEGHELRTPAAARGDGVTRLAIHPLDV